MTVEEATAILGLNKSQIDSDSILHHYNAKAKHCHPDIASYPGHEHDFKQTTKAFDLLKILPELGGHPSEISIPESDLEEVIEEFTYTLSIDRYDLHTIQNFWQKIWATDGTKSKERDHDYNGDILNCNEYLVIFYYEDPSPEMETEICRLRCPITSRLLERNYTEAHQFYEYVLQPIDKVKLRRDIELRLSRDMSLAEALEDVAFDYGLSSGGTALHPPTGKRYRRAKKQEPTFGQWIVIYCEAAIAAMARGRRILKNRHLVRNMIRDDELYAKL